MAAGEVRVSGRIEPAEMTLISLLQSVACVYYRSTVGDAGERRARERGYVEERSIGFRVRDATGSLRVFPRGARFDAPLRFQGETGTLGDEPVGLDIRRGGPTRIAEVDRAVAAAELLRVRAPSEWSPLAGVGDSDGRRSYRETRLELGDAVTIVGQAVPFSALSDPAGADIADGSADSLDDPEVAADLAAARAAGTLADDPRTPGGMRRSRASGSAARSRSPTSTRRRTGCRWPGRMKRRERRGHSRSPRRRWSSRPPTRSRCWSPTASRPRSRSVVGPGSWSASSGRSWRSARRCSWRPASMAGHPHEPVRGRGDLRRRGRPRRVSPSSW